MVLSLDGRPVLQYMFIWKVERTICSVLNLLCTSVRYGLVVRISGSHPGGPGSIPGNGNHLFLFPFDRIWVLLTYILQSGGGGDWLKFNPQPVDQESNERLTLNGRLKLQAQGKIAKISTRMGFEPTRAEPIGLAVQRLNHSATSSNILGMKFAFLKSKYSQ